MRARTRLLALALTLASAWLLGCSWTISPARQQRISNCIKRCEAQGTSPMATPNSHETYRDTRSPCERECHSLR